MNGGDQEENAREVGRIEVGRYVRLYDLSGQAPKLVFELRERPLPADFAEGPTPEEHVTRSLIFLSGWPAGRCRMEVR